MPEIVVDVIYRVHDTVTGEMYVGSKLNYLAGKYFGSPRLQRAKDIIKARPETLSVEILEIVANPLFLIDREAYWQNHFDVVKNPIYWNQCIAGKHFCSIGTKQSPESIAKKVAKIKGRKNTPETIEKMRQSAKKRISPSHTEEHKRNISLAGIGKHSIPRTEAQKKYHSQIMKGKKFPNRKGYVATESHRKNNSEALKMYWLNKRNSLQLKTG